MYLNTEIACLMNVLNGHRMLPCNINLTVHSGTKTADYEIIQDTHRMKNLYNVLPMAPRSMRHE